MEQKNNTGMIAMIIGIVAIVISIFGNTFAGNNGVLAIILVLVALVGGIVAIVMGVKARKDPNSNQGMGTAGLVTGIIATVFAGISVICVACVACAAVGVANLASDSSALDQLSSALNDLSSSLN
ncbi:MAG: DUF4190 domain-containing protein [Ruminococcus sp.]|nr:DUF4190 domain-containing protein [Ruminococcus sp.]